jgi:hypothetical protein
MNRKIAAGAAGGLIGGLVLDALMRVMPSASGQPMIAFAAGAVHASRPLAGWLAYSVYGVLIGALFGRLLSGPSLGDAATMVWGAVYGMGWWIVTGLVLLPAVLGVWPLSVAGIDRTRDVAFPLLIGHLAYGVVLGLAWSRITRWMAGGRGPGAAAQPIRRAA